MVGKAKPKQKASQRPSTKKPPAKSGSSKKKTAAPSKKSPANKPVATAKPVPSAKSIFEFKVTGADGKEVDLKTLCSGKVTLIVNLASKCGHTHQYKGLQELQDKFQKRGFTVLGFPCNQFGRQEPGSNEQIVCFAKDRYKATFPIMAKIEVNGPNEIPLYSFLKATTTGDKVKWNFSKFLCDKTGKVVRRYEPREKPDSLVPEIEKLLS